MDNSKWNASHISVTLKRTNFADKKLAHTHVATSNTSMLSQRTQMQNDIGTYPPLSDAIYNRCPAKRTAGKQLPWLEGVGQ